MTTPEPDCPIVRRAAAEFGGLPVLQRVIYHRAEEGRAKYGQSLSGNHKPERQKIVHQLQELLDAQAYELWREEPSEDRLQLLRELTLALWLEAPDLTFEELTHKESHSARDYEARLADLRHQRTELIASGSAPLRRVVALDAAIDAVYQQQVADRIRERAERRLAEAVGA